MGTQRSVEIQTHARDGGESRDTNGGDDEEEGAECVCCGTVSVQVALPMALTEAVELFHGEDQWREEAKEVKRMANALNDRLWSQSRLQEALSDSVETNSAVQDRIRANLLVHGAGLCGGDKGETGDIKFRLDQSASQYFANISSSVWVTLTANEVALLGDTAPVGDSTTVFLSEHVYCSIILYCPSEGVEEESVSHHGQCHPVEDSRAWNRLFSCDWK